ncbi:MAG: hypothetical protein JNM10_00015 [Planctomycetia bacterium]|nr:hypothetical protein [Planctomycetia bacterium]
MSSSRARRRGRWAAVAVLSSVLPACGGGGGGGGGGPVSLGTPTHTAAAILDLGGAGTDYAEDVARFTDGSFVVAGSHDAAITLGAGTVNETTFATAGAYFARYAADRSLVWARDVALSPSAWLASACALGDGRAVFAGQFPGSITFGEGEVNETTVTAGAGGGVFVVGFEADGDLSFAWAVTATVGVFGAALSPRSLGGFFLAGGFEGTLTLPDATAASASTLASAGTLDDVYLAAWDASDELVGVRQMSGPGNAFAASVAPMTDGGAIVAGAFPGTLLLGDGETNETTLTSAGGFDVFVARVGPNLDLMWARRAGGPGDDAVDAGAGAPGDGFAFAGSFPNGMTFDGLLPAAATLPSSGDTTLYVARYTPAGDVAWVRAAASAAFLRNPGLGVLTDGSVGLATTMFGTTTVDPQGLGATVEPADGSEGLFLQFAADGTFAWGRTMTGPDTTQPQGVVGAGLEWLVTVTVVDRMTWNPGGPDATTAEAVGTSTDGQILVLVPNVP